MFSAVATTGDRLSIQSEAQGTCRIQLPPVYLIIFVYSSPRGRPIVWSTKMSPPVLLLTRLELTTHVGFSPKNAVKFLQCP